MDSVFVHDLRLSGRHGVGHEERQCEQEFVIDIEAVYDSSTASKSDNIADTVDYVRFVEIAREVVEANSFFLIEKLADVIAMRILEDARINSVRILIKKPAVLKSGVPGIVIQRTR